MYWDRYAIIVIDKLLHQDQLILYFIVFRVFAGILSRQRTFSPLKIDGWKMKGLPFGASSVDFQGKELLVLGRVFFPKQFTCGISLD